MALKAEKLVFLTDTPGILRDRHDPDSLLPSLTPDDCRDLIARGGDRQGDDPQGRGLPGSLEAGVGKVHIIDGRLRHSLLLEIYTDDRRRHRDRPEGGSRQRPTDGRATVAVRTRRLEVHPSRSGSNG